MDSDPRWRALLTKYNLTHLLPENRDTRPGGDIDNATRHARVQDAQVTGDLRLLLSQTIARQSKVLAQQSEILLRQSKQIHHLIRSVNRLARRKSAHPTEPRS